jgi:hypothetical protein
MANLPTDGYDRDDLLTFLTDYGAALGAGDLEAIADRFAFPSLLALPDGSLVLSDPHTVHDSIRERLARFRDQDLVAAVPQVIDVAQAGPAFLWAEVRWSYRDENASEGAAERVRYLLRRARETFEICVILPLPL